MPLEPGARLDAYEIVRPLGSGGMGEVWLATEVRLGRKVALKLLPADVTRDASRVLRFEQEARAASGLSHPNVCTILALGETADGLRYIAMEYVEGETLRSRLAATRLSIRAALDIAIQVAAALSAAHASNVIHRDIKPENVMLRPDGFVKVLDFGLAKLAPSPAEMAGADSTRLALKTEAGVVVGTAAYMSPEQARGQEVDARTDIWSLGVLLYEMVAGRSPFAAPSGTEVLAAILDRDPAPLARFEPETPAELQRIITKCLRKEGALRYQVVQDLLLDLQALREDLPAQLRSGSGPAALSTAATERRVASGSVAPARPRRRLVLAGTIAVLIVAAALGAWWWRTTVRTGSSPAAAPVERTLTRLTFAPGLQTDVTFSPDGRFIAYASDQGDNFDIWVQPLAGGDPVQVTKSPAADTEPDWSPDGAQIVFRSERDGGGLFVVSALGGAERRLTSFGVRPKWSPDGSRVLFASEPGWSPRVALFVVGNDGTPPRRVLDRFIDDDALLGWAWHPDRRRVTLLGRIRQHPEAALHTVHLDGGSPITTAVPEALQGLVEGNVVGEFAWAPGGTALYFEISLKSVWNLWRLAMDPGTLEAGALTRLTGGAGQDTRLAISRDGEKLAFTTRSEAIRIWAYPLDPTTGRVAGAPQPLTDPTAAVPATAALSPDGRELAYSITGVGTGRWELWRADLMTGQRQLLSRDNYSRWAPKWSRDGSRLVYQWNRGSSLTEFEQAIAVRPASGGDETLLSQPARHLGQPHDWSPDGKSILLTSWDLSRPGQRAALSLWPLAAAPRAERAAELVAADPSHHLWQGSFSPNGRWISFLAVKTGAGAHAVVCIVPSTARQTAAADWTCLTDPSVWKDKPRWSSDGKLLYVWQRNGSLFNVWALRFDDARGRTVGTPVQVTEFESPAHRIWDNEIGNAEPSVAGNRMTLPIAQATGSVWMLDNADK